MGKKKYKKVELIIDEESEKYGVEAISLVEFPAIEENWVFFSKDNFLSLAKLDEEQKTLVGAVLIPNKEIPRFDQENNEEFVVYFSEETIKQAQELFMSSLRNNNATYEHKVPVEGITVVESWIKEDKKFDKSSAFGFNKLPLGTWFVKMKVNNEEIWKSVKDGSVKGFSIEGYFTDKLIEASKPKDIIDLAENCIDCEDEKLLEDIRSIIAEDEALALEEQHSFVISKALAKYPWKQCISDMVKEYGSKETAAKVCSAIKNKTVNR
tara:strand:- start:2943 stop:3743 length:801 start_codon:yes stop_codon:yes gene_type:complete